HDETMRSRHLLAPRGHPPPAWSGESRAPSISRGKHTRSPTRARSKFRRRCENSGSYGAFSLGASPSDWATRPTRRGSPTRAERLRPVVRVRRARSDHVAHPDLREVGAQDVHAVTGAREPSGHRLFGRRVTGRDVLARGEPRVSGVMDPIAWRLAVGIDVIEE